jgi:NAD(P)-dependent dehydrogenase (short-subunit alcohol dehydrogenase family)
VPFANRRRDLIVSRVFITGSSDGLGLTAATLLLSQGHEVVGHARNASRADDLRRAAPDIAGVTVGDLSGAAETRSVADQVNTLGRFDAVIHNAGVGYRENRKLTTVDGHAHVLAVNVLAPYLLTALIERPARLVYLSSGMHRGGTPSVDDLDWNRRRWNGSQAYSDSKLYDTVLAFAIARRWPDVLSNAVEPGWVATKMGGPGAPDDLSLAPVTQAWLAVSDDPAAMVSGALFYHQRPREEHPAARSQRFQDELLTALADLTGAKMPA